MAKSVIKVILCHYYNYYILCDLVKLLLGCDMVNDSTCSFLKTQIVFIGLELIIQEKI